MKKAIAMKCSQKDWDSIKEKFDIEQINSITSFLKYPYLTNAESNKIDNIDRTTTWRTWREKELQIHETFNAKIFLNACGIDCDVYEISKDIILKYNMKDEFPEFFKKELVVGKWYKAIYSSMNFLFYVNEINDTSYKGIGFDNNMNWNDELDFKISYDYQFTEATPQEVETALINEAKKRGYENGNYKCLNGFITEYIKEHVFHLDNDGLWHGKIGCANLVMNKNGKWATIIETISKEEAEKLLNKKIV